MSWTNTPIEMPSELQKLYFLARCHLGGHKVSDKMKDYVFGKTNDGMASVFDISLAWEKFVLAARAIAGIKCPEMICAVSAKDFGRKATLKISEEIGCKPITSRFIPGSFTNTTVKGSIEPILLIVSDPSIDTQAVNEAAQANCTVIAFCNTESPLVNVNIAIPVNNRSAKAVGAAFFILAKLVGYIRDGKDLSSDINNVELYFYRDMEELEKLQMEQGANDYVKIASANSIGGNEEDQGRSAIEASTISGRQ